MKSNIMVLYRSWALGSQLELERGAVLWVRRLGRVQVGDGRVGGRGGSNNTNHEVTNIKIVSCCSLRTLPIPAEDI